MNDKYFKQAKSIARWKINSVFEKWLSYRADDNDFFKRLYCWYYSIFDRKYYLGGLKFIESEISKHKRDIEGMDIDFIKRDMVYSLHRFGISFQNYWIYDFLHRNTLGRELFVSDKLRYAYCELLNAPDVNAICTDKSRCYDMFKSFYGRDLLGCSELRDKEKFIVFCEKHKNFILKPLNSHSGKGVHIVELLSENIETLFEREFSNGPFVVEELIDQDDRMSLIHPSSVNTLRVMTFRLKDDIKILAITMRIGCGNSVMDNAGAGGIFAYVDPETGIIDSCARNYKGETFIKHPDTDVVIPGFQLPDWKGALDLIKKLPNVRNGFNLISWDLAFSKKGWVLVEVNDNGDFMIVQNSETRALKSKLYSYMDLYFGNK